MNWKCACKILVEVNFVLFSCSGISPKASYSSLSNNSHQSKEAIGAVSRDNLASETYLSRVNGTNGAIPSHHSREMGVLDAVDDEYGGVVVDHEKLPSNTNAFAYVLRSSLSHWKMKVIC